jgi:hypothetical protein
MGKICLCERFDSLLAPCWGQGSRQRRCQRAPPAPPQPTAPAWHDKPRGCRDTQLAAALPPLAPPLELLHTWSATQ